jgi:hypothetical protein
LTLRTAGIPALRRDRPIALVILRDGSGLGGRAGAFALIALRNNGQADPRPDAKTFATLGAGGPLRTIAGAIALVAL